MTRNLSRHLLTIAVGAASAQIALPVSAQGGALMLEEVVVTAQKREQTLEDIPGSVSALSGEFLDKTNTNSLADVGKITAGIRLESTRDGNSPTIKIRGIGTQRFNASVSPSVGIFVDEIAKPRMDTAFTNLNDVARIEILKGPQATLYGKQVSAGLISIITNKPEPEEFSGKVQARIGSSDLQEYRGTLNVPLGESTAFRINAYTTDSTFEQVENLLTGDSEEVSTEGGRGRFLWAPNDQLELIFTGEYHETETADVVQERIADGPNYLGFLAADAAADGIPTDEDGLPLDMLPVDPFDGKVQGTAPISRKTRIKAGALHLSWDINNEWSLNSITSYEEYIRGTLSNQRSGDGGSGRLTGSAVLSGPALPGALHFTNNVDDHNYSQELRATYEGGRLTTVFGLYYAESFQNTQTDIARRIFPSLGTAILSSLDKEAEDIGIFTHNTWQLNEQSEIVLGLRYSEAEKNETNGTIVGGGRFAEDPLEPEIPKTSGNWDAVTGTLKYIHFLSDDVSVYGGYDRGFKPGGFNNPVYQAGSFNSLPDFDEETADNFEVGIKGRFLDRRLRWSLAAFYQIYDGFQLPIPDPDTGIGLITQNAGEVVSQGIETDFMWLASEYVTVDGTLAYIDSYYSDYENAGCYDGQVEGCGENDQDLTDKRVDNHSPWSATLNATYESTLDDSGLGWYVRGEAAFRDDFIGLSNHDPRGMHSSYTLYNASLGLTAQDLSWSVVLWGKNLTDEEYISTYLLVSDEGVPGNTRSLAGRIGDERSYGIDLTYHF
jgi:iron complex outermembrane receptor protein